MGYGGYLSCHVFSIRGSIQENDNFQRRLYVHKSQRRLRQVHFSTGRHEYSSIEGLVLGKGHGCCSSVRLDDGTVGMNKLCSTSLQTSEPTNKIFFGSCPISGIEPFLADQREN